MTQSSKKIFFIFLLLGFFISPLASLAQKKTKPETSGLHGDGSVKLFNYHLNEFIELKFRENGRPIPEALAKANEFLRSRGNQQEKNIELSLLDLIDHLQDHFAADTIEIISAYRDQEFNSNLLKNGHNVSPKSLHTQGRALDIHIDEIREETLKEYLESLHFGGIGFYPSLDFVHVDNGPERHWSENAGARKLIGVLNPEAPVQLTSDKNDYLPEENLFFTWSFQKDTQIKQVQGLRLELFREGKWTVCTAPMLQGKKLGLPSHTLLCKPNDKTVTFGKYRWTFKVAGSEEQLSSNEFYLKKR